MVYDNTGSGSGQLTKGIVTADDEAVRGLTKEQAQGILDGDPKYNNARDQVMKTRAARLAPPGSMNLPELLDKRRVEYAIPNDVFELGAAFDKVLVFQVSEEEKETFGDTSILVPDTVQGRLEKESPVGIICGAGLKARDILLTNGMDVGHKVAIVKLAPYRKEAGTTHGHRHEIMILRTGDIIGSVDLAHAMNRGDVRVVWNDDTQKHQYMVKDEGGDFTIAYDPLMPEVASEV